ncbi:uncharacterized protein C12orf50 homolog isoform X5 [Anas platyrhynchos]|uniref:uncharacterized protein C12orf50 homolog isoform X5 n=1 Tax=Anas platyrhynchos TaxID=8839 RepID=UPI000F7C6348|eukprot:XP_012960112.2 uncharacterized protein C12orf50 homolog isoform X6 [Anas platyrhynchos]
MPEVGNDSYFYFYSPYAQQKYSNISCFWETQPLGCVRISCVFHHSKPRNINGLFLPPSNNVALQEEVQEGILNPACGQESFRNQENILRPIHPPLIININHQEDEEEDEEDIEDKENNDFNLLAKTASDLEEERAIKEMCYKSGEYYRIHYPQEHQSTKIISSSLENELLPLEAIKRDLQKGGDCFVAQKNIFVEGKRNKALPLEKAPIASKYSNVKATSCSELVKKHHFKGVKKKKWISEEPRNLSNTVTGKENHTSNPKVKPSYQQSDKRKDDETAYSISVRQARRNTYFNSSEPRRSAYVFYRNVTDVQEPKFNGSMDKYTSGSCNAPTWRKRNPHAKTFTKFKTTIQSQEEMEMNIKGERFVERRKI